MDVYDLFPYRALDRFGDLVSLAVYLLELAAFD
jgi:hypothetical protein